MEIRNHLMVLLLELGMWRNITQDKEMLTIFNLYYQCSSFFVPSFKFDKPLFQLIKLKNKKMTFFAPY